MARRTYEFPRGAGAASEFHRSFAAKDAAQDDIVMDCVMEVRDYVMDYSTVMDHNTVMDWVMDYST